MKKPVVLDPSHQKLYIHPDGKVPKFSPRPAVLMVTPIYDWDPSQSPDLPRASSSSRGHRSHSHSRHHEDHRGRKRTRQKLHRRYSSHSPQGHRYVEAPTVSMYSQSGSPSTPPRPLNTHPAYTHSTAVGTSKARPPNDPLAQNPPNYQLQATHGTGQGSPYNDNRFIEIPIEHPVQASGTSKARPPNNPLAQNPPNYQLQATHGVGQGSPYSNARFGQIPIGHSLPPMSTAYSQGSGVAKARPSNDPIVQNTPSYQLQATHGVGNTASQGLRPPHFPPQQYASSAPATTNQHSFPQQYATSAPLGVTHQGSPHQYASSALGTMTHGRPQHYATSGHHGAAPFATPGIQTSSSRVDQRLQEYLRLLPPNPEWCLSRCTGKKRAVCIGINYVGQRDALKGCANDARHMRDFLIQYYNFPPSEVLVLTDDDARNPRPTRREMFNAFMWLVRGAKKDDSLFFHYSGHGGQAEDASGREADGLDEVIFPVDHRKAGDIIDDELYQSLVQHLPPGCRLTAVFDSCHSGTVLDLPYIHSAHGRLRGISHISRRARERRMAPRADVVCFSACRDDEKSADTFHGGVAIGAMSHALIRSLKRDPRQTYDELLRELRDILIPKYHQKAQISCSHPMDLSRRFDL